MFVTKSQVEQVIKLAQKANSFSEKSSSDAADGIYELVNELINPVQDEKWQANKALQDYLMGLEYHQLIDLAQLMAFGREWFQNRGDDTFFASFEKYKNEYRTLSNKELAANQLTGNKYLGEYLTAAIKHHNPDNH